MTFSERMRGIIHRGAADAKDLGSMGLMKLELMKLQSEAEKLMAKLGNEVFASLVESNHATVSRDSPSISEILKKIESVRAQRDLKEKEYQSLNGKRKAALRA
jgi:hypothetical protein